MKPWWLVSVVFVFICDQWSSAKLHNNNDNKTYKHINRNVFLLLVFSDHDSAPHLVSNIIILFLCVFRLLLKPLSPISAASWCLGCILHQPLDQVFEVHHLRLQGPQALLLTSQPLQALSAACLNRRDSSNMNSSYLQNMTAHTVCCGNNSTLLCLSC